MNEQEQEQEQEQELRAETLERGDLLVSPIRATVLGVGRLGDVLGVPYVRLAIDQHLGRWDCPSTFLVTVVKGAGEIPKDAPKVTTTKGLNRRTRIVDDEQEISKPAPVAAIQLKKEGDQ